MANIMTMPKLGMTMTSGVIRKWLKKENEEVQKGEPIVEIETDKVTMEEEAPFSGVLLKILVDVGESADVNAPIAVIGERGEDIQDLINQISTGVKEQQQKVEEPVATAKGFEQSVTTGEIRATPAARKLAEDLGVDLKEVAKVSTSSPIRREDVESYYENLKNNVPAGEAKTEPTNAKVIPFTGMRKIIAEKMSKSVNVAPHYYVTMEINMEQILKLRNALEEKVSINSFLVKASALAIKEFPLVNSFVDNDQIVLKDQINIGLAVSLGEGGLIVPVISEADQKSLVELSKEEELLIQKARDGKLLPDDYSGGSFTISNLGMLDVVRFTAIINQPEVAILAVGKITEKPVVEKGRIEIRPIMEATLSSDHRVIDGAYAAQFLGKIKEILEIPAFMVLK